MPAALPAQAAPADAQAAAAGAALQAASRGNDIPADFHKDTATFQYDRRMVDIPMRDGVKLHTVIIVPKGAQNAPMLLERTPYSANKGSEHEDSPNIDAVLRMSDDIIAHDNYIRVWQDVRGKYGSGGDYIMNKPLRGPLNDTKTDHATDTYDTIDWLVKNVKESNGRVGIIGTSYDGFTALMALIDPHPALKVAVPIAPMVDTWMGDDWFHQGAFRQEMLSYIYMQEATKDSGKEWWSGNYDDYAEFLKYVSAGGIAQSRGLDQLGFWRRLSQHPAYDAFWQGQALDKILAQRGITVPTLLVDGLWDQEDIYGAPAVFRAVQPHDPNHLVHLAMGPWRHGGSNGDGSSLGPIDFDSDTGRWFRYHAVKPFLDHFLKDGPDPKLPPVIAFETGANRWRRYATWPLSCETGCPTKSQKLYLRADNKLAFSAPAQGGAESDAYVSDPAHPVPYRVRPNRPPYAKESSWGRWLVDDQREFATRPDVLMYETDVLTAPVHIAGAPEAHVFAATTGTDADWVVKLIDVYPDEVPAKPELGGYQLMVSADILRGRYRTDFSHAAPIEAGKVLPYTVVLPQASHTFLPGHRIAVQIQSSWFPLYDRNPQSFAENIFFAKAGDFRKATQSIYRSGGQASFIDLPVIDEEK